jgi:hypothetical protein
MHDAERFSALIGDIYDAALDPSRWAAVLAQTACLVGGPAAALHFTDVANKAATVAYVYGMDPRYEKLYLDKYIKFDPVTTGYNFLEIGAPIAAGDLLRYDEFLETRFHREWMRPQGVADCLHAILDKSATSLAMLSISRDERCRPDSESRLRLIRLKRGSGIAGPLSWALPPRFHGWINFPRWINKGRHPANRSL